MATLRTDPEIHQALLDLVDERWRATDPAGLVARAEAVDVLLDLYGLTTDAAVQEEIGAVVSSWTGRTLLEGTEVLEGLQRVVAAAFVESAFAALVLPEA
jgi:hypothetical protein